MTRALRTALIVIAASAVALAVAQLISLWLPAQALFHLDSALHGVVGLTLALAAGAFVAASAGTSLARSIAFRIASALFAIACLVGLVYTARAEFDSPWTVLSLSTLALGLVIGAWASARPAKSVELGRTARAAAIVSTLLGVLAWGQVSVREAWAEYDEQPLAPFTLELVAAYPYDLSAPPGQMPAIVVTPDGSIGDVVALEGERFNLHRGDSLRIDASDVRRVRWISDGEFAIVTLRLGDRKREAFTARARSRSSQHDAVLLDGEPSLLYFYFGGPDDRVILGSRDRRALWRVYARLTRR